MPFRRLLLPLFAALAASTSAAGQSRTSQLHDALKLSAGQEVAWRAFLAASAPSPERRAQARAAERLAPTLPTPRRLALIRAQMQADLAAFDRTAQAVEGFYGQLAPEQQAAFDRQTRVEPSEAARPR